MKFKHYIYLITSFSLILSCARKGRPTGGPKDETAPIMVTANPPYETTNFNKKNIKIYFDEYISLKDLNKQLIISPPFKNQPIITPQGNPSKYINIKLQEELKSNTTYIFNFGNAIEDNNENNKLESFKYVFSTGKTIDSLTLKGAVKSSLKRKLNQNINLLLYKIDSSYNDSVPFKKKPNYVTSTNDSINFKFTNLKEGKYRLFAIKEQYNDYIFNSNKDEIGFIDKIISLPEDSIIKKPISLFKEVKHFKFKKGKEVSKGKIQFGFIGKEKELKIKLLSNVTSEYKSYQQFEQGKDTLNYWFSPTDKDSLKFEVSNKEYKDTINIRLRKKKIDSLNIKLSIKNSLNIEDSLFITTNNPIEKIEKSRINLLENDSLKTSFQIKKQSFNNFAIIFNQKIKSNYRLNLLPKAFTDIYNSSNDSISKQFKTLEKEDYGEILLNIDNKTKSNLIIQLIKNEEIIKSEYVLESKKIKFNYLLPNDYEIRAIIDENNNKIWDTGNLLKKLQPERIIYLNEKILLRANWTIDNTFIIE